MPIKSAVTSAVTAMILNGKSVLKPEDFDTHENYKTAVNHIKELSENGHVKIIYEVEETPENPERPPAILFLMTDQGKAQLICNCNP